MFVRMGFLMVTLLFPEVLFAQDLILDNSKWRSYETKDPKSTIVFDSSSSSVKVKTPGANKVEGMGMDAKFVPGNRYELSCKAKGEGRIMLCAYRKGGWVYGNKTPLTSDWQDFRLQFFTETENAGIYIITVNEKPMESAFEISDFKIEKVPLPDEMPKVEIEPLLFEAENYPGKNAAGKIVEDSSASGGCCIEGRMYYWLAENVPMPQTGLPFYIYLRMMTSDENMNNLALSVKPSSDAYTEVFSSIKLPYSGKWVWVKTEALNYKIGKSFSVSVSGSNADATAKLDALVISTRGDLTEADLDKIIGGK